MEIKRKHWSIEEKKRILAGYKRSGQSQREYAQRVGVGFSTLGAWLRQYRGEKRTRLVEVRLPVSTSSSVAYRVVMPSGARVEIGAGFQESELKQILGVMREVF